MTTIAYRSGTLAADSLVAYNTITNGCRVKIARCGRFLVALAGFAWLRDALESWACGGCDQDAVPSVLMENQDKFQALLIDDTGQVFEFDNGYLIPIHADYTAIGSGAALALGAMAHGATANEAVEAAARHDKNTGGPVTVLHYSTLK